MPYFDFDSNSASVLAPRDDVIRLLQFLMRTLARAEVTYTRADWEAVNRIACDLWDAIVRLLSHVEDEWDWDLGTNWDA